MLLLFVEPFWLFCGHACGFMCGAQIYLFVWDFGGENVGVWVVGVLRGTGEFVAGDGQDKEGKVRRFSHLFGVEVAGI